MHLEQKGVAVATFNLLPNLRRILRQRRFRRTRPGLGSRRLELEALEARDLPAGTWTQLTNLAPAPAGDTGDNLGTMLLLTDGTVMVQGGGTTSSWYKLTPNSSGGYINAAAGLSWR